MPKVMTGSELEELKTPRILPKQKVREDVPVPAPDVSSGERYLLMHPELDDDFEDSMFLDGIEYKRKCVNGIVTVDSPKVKDYLVSKGFIFLRSEKHE